MSHSTRTPWRTLLWLGPVALGSLACSDAAAPDAGLPGISGPDAVTATADAHARRPFRMEGTVQLMAPDASPPAPCLQNSTSELAGVATHLGRYHGVGSTCILSMAPDDDPPFTPAGPPPYLVATFSNPLWVITAANGDELRLTSIEAVAVLSGADGSLRAEGTQAVIGGTGRFAGATGELRITGRNDDGQGPDDILSEGWITY